MDDIHILNGRTLPDCIRNISSPPEQLFIRGDGFGALMARPRVAIVGSRRISRYGREVTARLAGQLAEQGIVIVSGLAFGVDAVAHQAALDAGGNTFAVLAGGLDTVYPTAHTQLATDMLKQGGALVSEYAVGSTAFKQNFVARNRIVAGLADALLITEAAEKSGTLHTARFALEQGIDVLAVPGNITSPTSAGTNNLIKTGAVPVTCLEDILHVLGFAPTTHKKTAKTVRGSSAHEQTIIDLLANGTSDGTELLSGSQLPAEEFNHHLTMLELSGKIRPLGNNHWSLR